MTHRSFGHPDQLSQGDHRAHGVVLRRREGSRSSQELLLFLKRMGAIWVSAPGADGAKTRFGGGTEPLVWGVFDFYQSPRRLYLKSVDVREDFLFLRASPRKLSVAVNWCLHLAKSIPAGHECDDLLSLLWGSLKNLALDIDPRLVDLRFAWRWGSLWGVAPSLESCCACGGNLDCTEEARIVWMEDGLLCTRCSASRPLAADAPSMSFAVLQEIRRAAMLPRDQFLAWTKTVPSDAIGLLGDSARRFYSFLRSE